MKYANIYADDKYRKLIWNLHIKKKLQARVSQTRVYEFMERW